MPSTVINIDLQITVVGFLGGGELNVQRVSGRECRGITEVGGKEAFEEHPAVIITNHSCVPSAYVGTYGGEVY